jgi:hypothetical protein
MPFLPFVLLLAWQAISKSASFALGWATALYFGQVPGRQGRVLAVVSLLAAGWLIVLAGFGAPLAAGAALDAAGIIGRNFSVEPIHVLALTAAIVLVPPACAAATVWAEFHDERSLRQWLHLVPVSYPAAATLGIGVLLMVLFTPVLVVRRLWQRQVLLQAAISMRPGTDDDQLLAAVRAALRSLGLERVEVSEAEGFLSWPMRTVGFAARHLIGAVVRGEPMRLRVDGLRLYAYATNVAVIGSAEAAYRVRAALLRELPFGGARLTWSDEAQDLEEELVEVHERRNENPAVVRDALDRLQRRMDEAHLDAEEWGVLYRIRLQVELESVDVDGAEAPLGQRAKVRIAKPATSTKAMKTTSSRAVQLTRRAGSG